MFEKLNLFRVLNDEIFTLLICWKYYLFTNMTKRLFQLFDMIPCEYFAMYFENCVEFTRI
jgi:hypothetical protein